MQSNLKTTAETKEAGKEEVTSGMKNALSKAESYLSIIAFSKSGLIDQLKYDGFEDAEAEYGVEQAY